MDSELLELRRRVLFPARACDFLRESAGARTALEDEFRDAPGPRKERIRFLLSELTIDLGSYLPRWKLFDGTQEPPADPAAVDGEVEGNFAALLRMQAAEEVRRCRSEIQGIRASNFTTLSRLSDTGTLHTRWGNDSAVDLGRAVRRGAVLVTTNPVMINDVRKKDPATWDEMKRQTWAAHPGASSVQIASFMTMEVVLRNCREMRPIFEATGGRYGYVCLQVNPKNCTDSEEMAEEVEILFKELQRELKGTPNTSFKVPGTHAGLKTAERLTAQGISVTITASASVSQIVRFAETIERGTAPASHLTMMTGRFDDPVREELLRQGAQDAEPASRWASVAVMRRCYDILYLQRRFKKSKLLAASIRGPWAIDGCITDGPSEVVITVFPDKALVYDSESRPVAAHMGEQIPAFALETLRRSEIFRDGYGVDALSPEKFDSFYPVAVTMKQFISNYEEFLQFIERRG